MPPGTALLIAIMALRAGALAQDGTDALHAQLGGIHASFLVGALAAGVAFVLSAFVTRAVPAAGGGHGAPEAETVSAH